MTNQELVAYLNLNAVLQNLEDLVVLDKQMSELVKSWDTSIQFSVNEGPQAHLTFDQGLCRHGVGKIDSPAIRLFFTSSEHLNKMFDNKANPIPIKGFTKLSFLKNKFSTLTDRLSVYLKPSDNSSDDFLKIKTNLMLNTAIYAVRELALHEPISKKIAASIPKGALQIAIAPEGPHLFIEFTDNDIVVGKGIHVSPKAKMTFADWQTAYALLTGNADAFKAVAEESIKLQGLIPIIDNLNLILDRVPLYLK